MKSFLRLSAALMATLVSLPQAGGAYAQEEPAINHHIEQLEQLMEHVVADPMADGMAFDGMNDFLMTTPPPSDGGGPIDNLETNGSSGTPDGNGGEPDSNDLPLDGGLTGLLIAGFAYGVQRQYQGSRKGRERRED